MSFRRFMYMIPNSQNEPLNLVLKIAVEGKDYTIFIPSDNMRCYLCGEHGHQKQTCPKQQCVNNLAGSQTTPPKNVQENNAAVQENNAGIKENNAAIKENNAGVKENNPAVHEVIDEAVERNVEKNNANTGDDTVDGATSANAVGRKKMKVQKHKKYILSLKTEMKMEYVETNYKNDDKSDEEVNE